MSPTSALKRPPAPLPSALAGEPGSLVDRERRRGRGTLSNATGRYEPLARVAFDDGWQGLEDLPPFKTTVTADTTRKIITRNDSPDISFDRSINPYRGCEHGCVYCFARPTHAYLGLSPGLDFESKRAGITGARIVSAELGAEGHRHRHQYRSVSADRAALQDHAPHPRSIGQRRPSGRHRDQIGAGGARSRYPGAHGQARSGQGRGLGHDLGREIGAYHGAARRDPPAPARRAAATGESRRASNGDGRASHSGAQRRRDRADPRSGRRGRRAPRRLRAVAAAARSPRPVSRLADDEFPRPVTPRVQDL